MVMKVSAPVFDRKLVPEGPHSAICCVVADLGLQKNKQYDKIQHKIYLQWLIPEQRIDIKGEDLPMALSKKLTLTWDDRGALLKVVQSWLGITLSAEDKESFDLEIFAGMPADLFVEHNTTQDGRKFASILKVSPYTGTVQPKIENKNDGKPVIYNADHLDTLELLPKWVQEAINEQVFPNDPEVVEDEPPV